MSIRLVFALLLLFVFTSAGYAQRAPLALGVDTANFDRSIRPQDDFFRYANGTWLKKTEIPADRANFGSFIELRDRSEEALKTIIDETVALKPRKAGSEQQKIADLYVSYMDSVGIERLGLGPIRPELDAIAALKTHNQLPAIFARLQRAGVSLPFGMYVGQDPKQATRYIVSVSQSGLGMPDRDYYLRDGGNFDQTRKAYSEYQQALFKHAGVKDPAGTAARVYSLERKLAEQQWDRAKNRDRELTYNLKTVKGLEELAPEFGWQEYLNTSGVANTPGVVVRQPDYLQALDSVLAATPLSEIKEYLTLRVLDAYASVLPRAFADASFAFRGRVLSGQQVERPRWKRGVSMVESSLGEAVGRLYVERHFKPEQKERMQKLVGNLVAAFREGIDRLEWMSPETKQQAQAKLASFNVKIGYPDKWRDYSALQIRPDDLAGNVRRTNEFQYNRMVKRLGQPIDRTEWGMTPQTVNAYYSSTMNEIVFPAAILQPPFFNPEADDAVNYGAIGAVIGHEISHGFDDQGRRSDGSGNLRDWWTEEDNTAFKARADRLVGQYDSYSPVEGLNVNGRLTLGENIGDLSGLAVAYAAYRRSLEDKEAPVIEGFTGDQRFFLGWAQIWRRKDRDESLRNQILTDPHSPSEFRVNGPLRNMAEFYAAFGVKPGDKMYLPEQERVKIW